MFTAVAIIMLLTVLLAPSWIVLLLFDRVTLGQAVRTGWRVWVAQVIASIALIFLADTLGLLNPAGYTLGLCVLVGIAGAFFLRRQKAN
jgi:hypothetical protein